MTFDQAAQLKRGDAILYRPYFGDGYPEEVRFVKLHLVQMTGEIVLVCYDSHGVHRWGTLDQYSHFPTEFNETNTQEYARS